MGKPFAVNNIEFNSNAIELQSFIYDRKTFYVNPDTYKIHTGLPMNSDNVLNDQETKRELFDQLEKYKQKKEKEVSDVIHLMNKIDESERA